MQNEWKTSKGWDLRWDNFGTLAWTSEWQHDCPFVFNLLDRTKMGISTQTCSQEDEGGQSNNSSKGCLSSRGLSVSHADEHTVEMIKEKTGKKDRIYGLCRKVLYFCLSRNFNPS